MKQLTIQEQRCASWLASEANRRPLTQRERRLVDRWHRERRERERKPSKVCR